MTKRGQRPNHAQVQYSLRTKVYASALTEILWARSNTITSTEDMSKYATPDGPSKIGEAI